ncbi:membrane protein [Luteitalea sp. TBR-22]|uniref:GDYXXLXY domain-containing protein n=1 Tax=Luteitalea sp. TBR-22 TaxID=2802971 RepID=UPI001AF9F6F6|nr:GDYXXLXY domain-containing protein [Luteitalea sp. TBR-22]BCS31062.1 membrane protein [Luteitalea sp. TBR-22]
MIRRALIVVGLAIVLGLVGFETAGKERLLATGQVVLLELAPRDPRSLIQGDYMQLDYAIARRTAHGDDWPRDGAIVVSPDDQGVAQFRRRDGGEPLAAGETRLAYRLRGGRLQIGTNAFYFQEGAADTYAPARYGELRVGPDGTSLLVGLRDADRQPLGTR